MKKLLFFASVFCFIVFVNNTLLAQYSNATLNGTWLTYVTPLQPFVNNTMYMGFDGNGNITYWSGFGPSTGSNYSVSASGAISCTMIIHNLGGGTDTMQFSGQLNSQNTGDIGLVGAPGIYRMRKLANPGALTDSLTGTLNFFCSAKNITLHLNSSGVITSANGNLTSPVSGRVYADSGIFIGHIKTGDTSIFHCGASVEASWDEFTIIGTYKNDSLVGTLSIDGPNNSDTGTVNLLRKGSASGLVSIAASAGELIIYPNPASDIVALNINKRNNEDLTLKIYNAIGALVKSETLKQDQQKINVHDLSNGIYTVEVKSNDWSAKQKLIIQR
jgi:hypothetical protein